MRSFLSSHATSKNLYAGVIIRIDLKSTFYAGAIIRVELQFSCVRLVTICVA